MARADFALAAIERQCFVTYGQPTLAMISGLGKARHHWVDQRVPDAANSGCRYWRYHSQLWRCYPGCSAPSAGNANLQRSGAGKLKLYNAIACTEHVLRMFFMLQEDPMDGQEARLWLMAALGQAEPASSSEGWQRLRQLLLDGAAPSRACKQLLQVACEERPDLVRLHCSAQLHVSVCKLIAALILLRCRWLHVWLTCPAFLGSCFRVSPRIHQRPGVLLGCVRFASSHLCLLQGATSASRPGLEASLGTASAASSSEHALCHSTHWHTGQGWDHLRHALAAALDWERLPHQSSPHLCWRVFLLACCCLRTSGLPSESVVSTPACRSGSGWCGPDATHMLRWQWHPVRATLLSSMWWRQSST